MRALFGRAVEACLPSVNLRQVQQPCCVHAQQRAGSAQILVDVLGVVPDGSREAEALERPLGRSTRPREEGVPKSGPLQKRA